VLHLHLLMRLRVRSSLRLQLLWWLPVCNRLLPVRNRLHAVKLQVWLRWCQGQLPLLLLLHCCHMLLPLLPLLLLQVWLHRCHTLLLLLLLLPLLLLQGLKHRCYIWWRPALHVVLLLRLLLAGVAVVRSTAACTVQSAALRSRFSINRLVGCKGCCSCCRSGC
jgi:hypothetical protein